MMSKKLTKAETRVDAIFRERCSGIRVPAVAVAAVYGKGLVLAVSGLGDDEIALGMIQEARDAANALSAAMAGR